MDYILIVDDKRENLLSYEAILEEKDRVLVTAQSGEEGLKKVLDHEYALIILDVQMPEMDGFEFAQLIKSNKKTSSIPVIFITAAITDLSSIKQGYNVGAVDYLAKPLNNHILQAKVNAFIEMHRTKTFMSQLLKEYDNAQQSMSKLTEELKRSNDDLSRFSYACSHDLKTPIRNVKLLIELLELDLKEELSVSDEIRDLFQKIGTSLKRMDELIRSVLIYSISQQNKEHYQIVNLNQLIMEVLDDFQEDINLTKAFISVSELPEIKCQPTQIKQVFANLINNALKYNTSRPEISITSEIDQDEFKIHIKDNGIGFDMSNAETIMLPFERLVTVKQYPGSGIGLATCKNIISAHEGTINCYSVPGEGSTFTVHLKKDSLHLISSNESQSEESNNSEKKFTVLSVDDDPTSQYLIKRTLSKIKINELQLEIEEAFNGIEALEKIKTTPFNLIILDENMPIMKGSEVAKEIKRMDKSHIPIIAHSTMDKNLMEDLYKDTGVQKIYTKFLSIEDANNLVRELKAM